MGFAHWTKSKLLLEFLTADRRCEARIDLCGLNPIELGAVTFEGGISAFCCYA